MRSRRRPRVAPLPPIAASFALGDEVLVRRGKVDQFRVYRGYLAYLTPLRTTAIVYIAPREGLPGCDCLCAGAAALRAIEDQGEWDDPVRDAPPPEVRDRILSRVEA